MKEVSELLPASIDNTKYNYLKVDDKYLLSLVIYDYPKKISFREIIEKIDKKYLYDMSLYISKQDIVKVLKEISYNISNSKSELKTSSSNQIDIDILKKHESDASTLRKKIQIDNEEIYKINLFITFYFNNKNELFKIVKNFQSKLFSNGILSNITNFRNLDSYLLTLPLNNYNNKLINKTYRNITTSALLNFFPFYTKAIFDKNGIVFGYTKKDNKLSIIDIFDSKYLNSNITIFGSSGSGKSYFTKLLILRHFLKDKLQYILDIEGEYEMLAKKLNFNVIKFNSSRNKSYLNIFDITDKDILLYGERFLDEKINELISFLKIVIDLNDEEIKKLKCNIKEAYLKKGINEDINSLYLESKEGIVYVNKKNKYGSYFPNMNDVDNEILDIKLKEKIKAFIEQYPEFSKYSNIDFNLNLVFNTSNLEGKKLEIVTSYILNRIIRYLKNNLFEKEVIIYIDEIWRYINSSKRENISFLISKLYKSIRKNRASIVTITQDISDFFSLDNGSYGKSILNNSEFKIFFKLEFSDSEFLQKLNVLSRKELKEISRLEKGNTLLAFCNNITLLKIKASEYEHEIIEGDGYEYSSSVK